MTKFEIPALAFLVAAVCLVTPGDASSQAVAPGCQPVKYKNGDACSVTIVATNLFGAPVAEATIVCKDLDTGNVTATDTDANGTATFLWVVGNDYTYKQPGGTVHSYTIRADTVSGGILLICSP